MHLVIMDLNNIIIQWHSQLADANADRSFEFLYAVGGDHSAVTAIPDFKDFRTPVVPDPFPLCKYFF